MLIDAQRISNTHYTGIHIVHGPITVPLIADCLAYPLNLRLLTDRFEYPNDFLQTLINVSDSTQCQR